MYYVHMPKPDALKCYWSTKMDNVKLEVYQPIIIKRFGRRKIKKSLALFPPSLTIYLPFAYLTFACVLSCGAFGTGSVCSFDIFKDPKDRSGRARPLTQ